MVEGRTEWTDKRLDDQLTPLRGLPEAVARLEERTNDLTKQLAVNTAMQRQRNQIMLGFLGTLVVGLLSALVVLVVAL